MKNTLAILALSITCASAQSFKSQEVSFDLFGVGNLGQNPAEGEAIAEDTFGAGLGASLFFYEAMGNHIGFNIATWSTDWTDISGPFFDDARVTLEVRRPVGDSGVALGVFFGEGYSFEKDDRYEVYGGKLSLRPTQGWELFLRGGYKTDSISAALGGSKSFDGHAFGEIGLSIIPKRWQSE